MTQAVLVMAYGGPDSLDDIEPYLSDIRGGRATPPELIEEIRERYALIGGKSPLLGITREQAALLERDLNQRFPSQNGEPAFRTYVGMRHWTPYIQEALQQIATDGITQGLALCMAPHASRMSTGAYLRKLREAESQASHPVHLDFLESWYDRPFLIQSLAQKVRQAVPQFSPEEQPHIHYLFTAHSLPTAIMDQGDPYANQLLSTAQLLAKELQLAPDQWSFGYQSAGAAAGRWLGPAVEDLLPQFAAAGKTQVLVCPVGFMADHVEILFDLDIEAQHIARNAGVHLVRSESLNASPMFIAGLAEMVVSVLNEPRTVSAD
jgi:ferrochelatase